MYTSVILALFQTGVRSTSITVTDPSSLGSSSLSPPLKVILPSAVWTIFAGNMAPSGDLPLGTDIRRRSIAYLHVLSLFIGLKLFIVWAWPIYVTQLSSPRKNHLPNPSSRKENQVLLLLAFGYGAISSEISSGFIKTSLQCISLDFSFGMYLLVGSPGSVLFQSLSSSEDKLLPPYPLPKKRGVSSSSLPSVYFSSLIALLPYVAVSTEPEGAIKITLVIFVDEIWTSTSHHVTILQPSGSVVKAIPTHSSIVSNSLSSSVEDLSILVYLYVVNYVYRLRGWIIPSYYCIEED
ncbi:hypothetical protein N665_3966s0002 [Sinapis alba]|nr:hypothetical protein N665_3966s0002 [Sinapis alba]